MVQSEHGSAMGAGPSSQLQAGWQRPGTKGQHSHECSLAVVLLHVFMPPGLGCGTAWQVANGLKHIVQVVLRCMSQAAGCLAILMTSHGHQSMHAKASAGWWHPGCLFFRAESGQPCTHTQNICSRLHRPTSHAAPALCRQVEGLVWCATGRAKACMNCEPSRIPPRWTP